MKTTVHAIWGRTQAVESTVVYRNNTFGATFMCKGTTLDYQCKLSGRSSVRAYASYV